VVTKQKIKRFHFSTGKSEAVSKTVNGWHVRTVVITGELFVKISSVITNNSRKTKLGWNYVLLGGCVR